MTLEELTRHIENAAWFTRLGQFPGGPGRIALKNLDAWEADLLGRFVDCSPSIADAMDWLPTTRTGYDPIHGDALKEAVKHLGKEEELARVTVDMYKTALRSLRSMNKDHPLLKVGATHFANAAEGAALYAVRQAATEITVDQQGFYCSLIPLYVDGYWPCGITNRGELVVL